jgi:hypothetical protein
MLSRMISTPRRRRGEFSMSQSHQRQVDLASLNDVEDESMLAPASDHPQTTEQDPAVTTRVIWGTTVNIEDAMSTFTDFLRNYKRRYLLEKMNAPITELDNEPFYPKLLQQASILL